MARSHERDVNVETINKMDPSGRHGWSKLAKNSNINICRKRIKRKRSIMSPTVTSCSNLVTNFVTNLVTNMIIYKIDQEVSSNTITLIAYTFKGCRLVDAEMSPDRNFVNHRLRISRVCLRDGRWSIAAGCMATRYNPTFRFNTNRNSRIISIVVPELVNDDQRISHGDGSLRICRSECMFMTKESNVETARGTVRLLIPTPAFYQIGLVRVLIRSLTFD